MRKKLFAMLEGFGGRRDNQWQTLGFNLEGMVYRSEGVDGGCNSSWEVVQSM